MFNGSEDQWIELFFVTRAYLSSHIELGASLVEAAEERIKPDISLPEILGVMGPPGVAASKALFFSLAMTVKGSGQRVIRSVETNNGAVAWRALCGR